MLRAFLSSAPVEDFQQLYLRRQEKLKLRVKAQCVSIIISFSMGTSVANFFVDFLGGRGKNFLRTQLDFSSKRNSRRGQMDILVIVWQIEWLVCGRLLPF
jgi:hypothetical protein